MATLTFSHITINYQRATGEELCAVKDFSLEVEHGASVAFIGPSGCGKSSLLRVACGVQTPTTGAMLVNGEVITEPKNTTALILQDFGLLPWKTVYQNAELGLLIQGVDKNVRETRTHAALEQVGLAGFEKSYPKELSGGMKQRLALARALAMNIDTLLMDEPLSALDAMLREEMQDTLLELWKTHQHTQIIVTHSIEEAVYLGQRIVVLSPRPGSLVTEIPNNAVGERKSSEFLATCNKVREAISTPCAQAATSEAICV